MKKNLCKALILSILTLTSFSPVTYAAVDVNTLPTLDSAINADVTVGGNNMNIQITGGNGSVGSLNWESFNVGKDAGVNFEFTDHNQTALNKVSATGGLSQIYGKITSSGCYGCGYDMSGKVILINPNGVLFGDGANVNLNSFTVSTLDGTFNPTTNTMEFVKNSPSDFGIVVQDGAKIYGDKAVNLIGNNVTVYNGSKISTNIGNNYGDSAVGRVKIVTGDGVNFTYYNNGGVKNISNEKVATDKMMIYLNGEINSGNIDVRNLSNNSASEINLYSATLKATKAVKGNDGNIWLTANNKIIVDSSDLRTEDATGAENRTGGNIILKSTDNTSLKNSKANSTGDFTAISYNKDSVIDSSVINAGKNANITAKQFGSVQNNSTVNAQNINITGEKRAQAVNSNTNATNDINMNGENIWVKNAILTATNQITGIASTGFVLAENATLNSQDSSLSAKTNLTGSLDLSNKKTTLNAGNDLNVTLKNVSERNYGLTASAGNDMTVTTDGTLSVSSLISGNNMTINADKVIAGLPYTKNEKLPDDLVSERSYIEVGGTFISNTRNDSYKVTASGEPTPDKQFNKRHHIEYGNGTEKILLVNKRPFVGTEAGAEDIDGEQASKIIKLPAKPDTMSNVTNITDGRTTLVDVFAAASQIEIEDDEE